MKEAFRRITGAVRNRHRRPWCSAAPRAGLKTFSSTWNPVRPDLYLPATKSPGVCTADLPSSRTVTRRRTISRMIIST